MENIQIKEIVDNLLNDKGRFWKVEEIEEYLKPYMLEDKQILRILSYLADDYVFKWLDFISQKLPNLASEEGFICLLKKVISKVKGDMAQGSFIRALIRIGEQNEEIGRSLYQRMVNQEDDANLIYYSSFPLGGSGRKNFESAFSIISEQIRNKNPNIRATCIRGLRIIFENSKELKRADEIFDLLSRLASEQEDKIVQIEVLNAYFDFSPLNYAECVRHLKEFARRRDSVIRFRIADLLWFRNLTKKEDEIDLLSICAKDDDSNVLSKVALALSEKGQEFPEYALRIMKTWILRGKYYEVHDIDYSMKKLGKSHLDRCVKEVEAWVEEKDGEEKLRFFIPTILQEIGEQNYDRLIALIEPWLSKSNRFQCITLSAIRKILTEISSGQDSGKSTIDSCFRILTNLAEEKTLNVAEIIKGENDKLFQCFRLIESLQSDRKDLDFDTIALALDRHAAINNFVGPDWFNKMKQEGNKTHPLLGLLSRSILDEGVLAKQEEILRKENAPLKREFLSMRIANTVSPKAYVDYLNELLNQVTSKTKKTKDLANGLRNPDQFWQTISEIEVISAFIDDYRVEIAPKIKDKKLDLSVEFDGEVILFEVINPDMFKPLKYITEKAFGLENRARKKIYDEFKTHLKDSGTHLNDKSVMIVIDIGRSEIDYDFVEDYLLGTLQFTLQIEKATGKVVDEYLSRGSDSMHALEEKTDVVGAVVCYKTSIEKDMKFHRRGKITLNPHARIPLSQKAIQLIQKSLFV